MKLNNSGVCSSKEIFKDESVGYNSQFTADKNTRIAVISIGYTDSIPRVLAGGKGHCDVVVPLTVNGEWRGFADVVAVGFYLSGIVPLLGMALLDLGLIGRKKTELEKLKLHATFVLIF